jgi:hypothetical protein
MVMLGDRVQDKINGFTGIAIGRAEYLFGCIQVLVAPEGLDKDGKPPDGHWLDEDRVKVVEPDAMVRPDSADERAGGPLTNPAPPVR